MKLKNIFLAGLLLMGAAACSDDDAQPTFPEEPTYDMTGFAKGADVSWLTEMENEGVKFYSSDGNATECMTLLRDLGVNSIRLRVWVNPTDGWCNKNDVVAKAWRAAQLGMRVMIDFHYSDTWADPGSQYKPAAWEGLSIDELKTAISDHTKDVLNALKDKGVTPEWVQVGNENGPGMLWDTDEAVSGATYNVEKDDVVYAENTANFAAFITTGCQAVKEVFPNAKVIVHLQEGNNNDLYRWIFDILKAQNAEYDVIGMSLYPEVDTWQSMTNSCVANMEDMVSRYGKEVMICEVGMSWDEAETAKTFLTDLITKSKAIDECLGVFYWEPQCYDGWNGYTKGAFDEDGKPTVAMDAFGL
ncbi:MAG: glycosyl hydrolase 53 family protein [Bacteroides sp.]|nr:glycosyl hydrolase 53 family protein [Bacteroides sp.]